MDSKPRSRGKDPSLKARKDLFFDDTPAVSDSDVSRKPFRDYLHETPPAPLPPLIKAGLWAAAAVVALLLVAAMYRVSRPRKPKPAATQSARVIASDVLKG